MNDSVLVLCDSHISIYKHECQKKIIDFITERQNSYGTLVLLGDIFDFYFDYENFIPKNYFPLLNALKNLSKSKKIYITAGNHDMWLGRFFDEFIEAESKTSSFVLDFCGKKYFMSHGDEFEEKSIFRKIADKLLKSGTAIKLFSILHPELAYRIGDAVSKMTLKQKENKNKAIKMFVKIKSMKEQKGYSAVITGHAHGGFVSKEDNVFILGDFITRGEFAYINDGGVKIEHI